MAQALALLRTQPTARLFFAALAQSSLGTGAAYVALLVVAYQRFHSPWAITLVLLADFVPSMVAGPIVGAAADRWPRRWCALAADLIRGAAFVAIAVVDSFAATVAFALFAGCGTALFRPAVLAGLPHLVPRKDSATATALYSAITDFGYTGGPAIAAAALLVMSAEGLLIANGVTFCISAAVVARLPLGRGVGAGQARQESLLTEAADGLRALHRAQGVRVVVAASAAIVFFGGVFNVVELPFATNALHTDASGYSVLITVYGLGFIGGSLTGAHGGSASRLKRRFLQGLALTGVGGLAAGASPTLGPALAAFALGGFGNGLSVVHQRLLVQTQVPQSIQGRVFGVTDGLLSWGYALGFIAAGSMAELASVRTLILLTGVGGLALATVAAYSLRRSFREGDVAPADVRTASPAGLGGGAVADVLPHVDTRN